MMKAVISKKAIIVFMHLAICSVNREDEITFQLYEEAEREILEAGSRYEYNKGSRTRSD